MTPADLSGRGTASRGLVERVVLLLLQACVGVTVLITLALVWTLGVETVSFFRQVSLFEFLTETRWTPLFEDQHFGILPLLAATVQITVGAAVVAVPIGVLSAIYLSEYARPPVRAIVKPSIEVLAGVPTVVFGYFALTFVTPLIRRVWPTVEVFNGASASVVVGLMILPTVVALSEEALSGVRQDLREAAVGLGASQTEVIRRVVLPAASSGIVASFILAMSRAVGETMVVTIAAGNQPKLTWSPFEALQTMTAFIVQVSLGETPRGTLEYSTIFAVGSMLFVVTYVMNLVGRRILAPVTRRVV